MHIKNTSQKEGFCGPVGLLTLSCFCGPVGLLTLSCFCACPGLGTEILAHISWSLFCVQWLQVVVCSVDVRIVDHCFLNTISNFKEIFNNLKQHQRRNG
jgi:hypothetical protein